MAHEDLKTALLGAIAGQNRGILSTASERQTVLDRVAELETHNPTPLPLEAPDLLSGDWRLLYTTSAELLGIDRFPLYNLGQVYQCIRATQSTVYNVAEIKGIPYLEGLVSVAARFEPISQKRVQVKFERAVFGLQRIIGYQSPAQFVQQIEAGNKFIAIDFPISRDRQGWLDITYLDANFRIGRGNEGSVFVLTK